MRVVVLVNNNNNNNNNNNSNLHCSIKVRNLKWGWSQDQLIEFQVLSIFPWKSPSQYLWLLESLLFYFGSSVKDPQAGLLGCCWKGRGMGGLHMIRGCLEGIAGYWTPPFSLLLPGCEVSRVVWSWTTDWCETPQGNQIPEAKATGSDNHGLEAGKLWAWINSVLCSE